MVNHCTASCRLVTDPRFVILAALTLLVVVVMALTAASSDDAQAASDDTAGDVSWTYNYTDDTLEISGTGELSGYYGWPGSAKLIKINEGITALGNEIFREYPNLETVVLPKSLEIIGTYSFGSCTSLKEVSFAKDGNLVEIGEFAFSNCTSLKTIDIPESVTTVCFTAFGACTSLEKVVFEGNGLKGFVIYAFAKCCNLKYINFPSSLECIYASNAFMGLKFIDSEGHALSITASSLRGHVFTGDGDGTLRLADATGDESETCDADDNLEVPTISSTCDCFTMFAPVAVTVKL